MKKSIVNDYRYEKFLSLIYKGNDINTKYINYFDPSNVKILDVACGNGTLHYLLEKKNYKKVTGFDINKEKIQTAQKNHPTYKYFVQDACDSYPFEKNSFDIVICKDAIEHVYCPKKMIQEILQVLNPWGFCIVRTPNALRMELEKTICKQHIGDAVFQYISPSVLELLINSLGGKMVYLNCFSRLPPFDSIYCKFVKKFGIRKNMTLVS